MSQEGLNAGWISRLFPKQTSTGSLSKKHQTNGGKTQRRSSKCHRGGRANEQEPLPLPLPEPEPKPLPEPKPEPLPEPISEEFPNQDDINNAFEILDAAGYDVTTLTKKTNVNSGNSGFAGGRRRKSSSIKKSSSSNSKMSRTSQKVQYGGSERVVYEGVRGGKYIKKGGEFVPISKL